MQITIAYSTSTISTILFLSIEFHFNILHHLFAITTTTTPTSNSFIVIASVEYKEKKTFIQSFSYGKINYMTFARFRMDVLYNFIFIMQGQCTIIECIFTTFLATTYCVSSKSNVVEKIFTLKAVIFIQHF